MVDIQLMPSVYSRFTAYTCDCLQSWSAVLMDVRLNICACLCVPLIQYINTSCRAAMLATVHWTTDILKPLMRHRKKSYFSVTFYPSVLFRCHVTIQQGSHISNPLLPESVWLVLCRQKCVVRTVWGYVFQFIAKQNLCLLQGWGQLDRRGKRWKDEASYVQVHEAFKDSCTAVTLSLSLGAIEEAMPCLFNHLSSAKIILHVLYVYVISFLKK